MTTQKLDLQNKWFYRLVKVLYIFFLAVGLIGVLCIGWCLKPYQLVDTKKSYLTCPDGTRHSFHSLDLYFDSKKSFSDYDAKKAIKMCGKHSDEFEKYRAPSPEPYPTHWEFKELGSWLSVMKFWLWGIIIVFIIINVTKQSLVYIVYGKKFNF
ncbi:Uncharacterised protein [Legionella steigerwaltii]|uniref:Uncharacterized protein n=1 Tax=Legionella steigerwaltii TaxID=460 RepID=A0A378LKJ7_9GAMM|nr:hypothetical protein [Legionella steigerwaltii]KTD79514.1 hypothetical protein Lstg_0730 [Legionella steigerwaltii]STY24601.1 Uncharacterised protein [Legionella steigerwaltii]